MINLLKWCFIKPWPITIFIPIITIHLFLIYAPCIVDLPCFDNSQINKYCVFIMQLIGGILIFKSIGSNIELFKKENITELFKQWLNSCPFIKAKKPVGNVINGTLTEPKPSFRCFIHNSSATGIEREIELLKLKIDTINKDIIENNKIMDIKLKKTEDLLSKKISAQSQEFNSLESDVIKFTIGDYKLQVFGALLIFYSLMTGLFI